MYVAKRISEIEIIFYEFNVIRTCASAVTSIFVSNYNVFAEQSKVMNENKEFIVYFVCRYFYLSQNKILLQPTNVWFYKYLVHFHVSNSCAV